MAYRYVRFDTEPINALRQDSERDRDRILYSSAFRRLNGVTQVAAAHEVGLFHNRLTHSLKVGQTARKIGATLRFLCDKDDEVKRSCRRFSGAGDADPSAPPVDGWVLEAAGLAHDLGHPPFGHIGEATLQKAVSDEQNTVQGSDSVGKKTLTLEPRIDAGYHLHDSFEGNAQSFRIVTRLSFGKFGQDDSSTGLGLNLTRASLSAISKYPWLHAAPLEGVNTRKKWGAYHSEQGILDWSRKEIDRESRRTRLGTLEYRTIEAQAMDWADDISYAVHDMEDFCRAGLIPLEELTSHGTRQAVQDFWAYCRPKLLADANIGAAVERGQLDLDACLEKARVVLGGAKGAAVPGREGRELLRDWAATNIESWTGPGVISVDPRVGSLEIEVNARTIVEILKALTWYFVIDRPALASAQRGQSKVLRELFVWLVAWCEESYDGLENRAKVFGNVRRKSYASGGLPARLVDFLDITFSLGAYDSARKDVARAVTDYLSSLTEVQAVDLHNRLGGSTQGPMLDGWFTV